MDQIVVDQAVNFYPLRKKENKTLLCAISSISKEAGKSLQRFSDSYTLKDENYHCLTSSATTMEKRKCPIIV